MAWNGLSVSVIFIQCSVVNRESKFETRKFDRERKWFVPLILNNAFLEPGCIRLTWPMITRQTRARKQNGNLLRKNSWTTGSILVFFKVCTCEVFFMLKDFIGNEYFVLISWKSLNKIKYLNCTRSNFKSNVKQTALSNKPFMDSFYSSYNFCLKSILLFLMTLFYWYCNTDICTFGKLLANLKIPSQPIVPCPQWLGGKLECLSFVDGPGRQDL